MSKKETGVQQELQKRLREQQKLSEAIFRSLSQRRQYPKDVKDAVWPDQK